MDHLHIFIDGSVNSKSKQGFGACLLLTDLNIAIESVKNLVQVKCFVETSSTKLELQTLLWSLKEAIAHIHEDETVFIYTDSQNIVGLPARRARLEQNEYFSSKNRRLNNYELYQEFYHLTSRINCEIVKIVGHQASYKKDKIDQLFAVVDKASRRAMRGDR